MLSDPHEEQTPAQRANAWLKDGQPDWDAIDFELPCSRCGYELRMLTLPRCPECGLRFEWRAILEARLRQNEFLFEYRWRDRPVRGYLGTVWRALRPWRFWREVSIHERIYPGPLFFMFFSSVIVFMLVVHGLAGLLGLAASGLVWLLNPPGAYPPSVLAGAAQLLLHFAVLPLRVGPSYLALPAFVLLDLSGAAVLLCSLRQTIGRCRVRTIQVFRVVAYSAVPVCLLSALLFVSLSVPQVIVVRPLGGPGRLILAAIGYLPPLIFGIFLAIGLRRYLHLPRAWLLGLTAAGVGLLFAAASLVLVGRLLRGF